MSLNDGLHARQRSQATRRAEPPASYELRRELAAKLAALPAEQRQDVAAWMRRNGIHTLKKPGPTLTELNRIEDYVAAITEGPAS